MKLRYSRTVLFFFITIKKNNIYFKSILIFHVQLYFSADLHKVLCRIGRVEGGLRAQVACVEFGIGRAVSSVKMPCLTWRKCSSVSVVLTQKCHRES